MACTMRCAAPEIEPGVAAQDDEAIAPRDHRARVVGREGDAAQRDVAVGEDLRFGLRDDLAQVGMLELAGHAETLREIAARHRDDVEPADRENVVQRVHAGLRLDQHDVQHGVVGGLEIREIR